MTLDQLFAAAQAAGVTVIPLLLWLHQLNRRRWDMMEKSIRKARKRLMNMEHRLDVLDPYPSLRYNRGTVRRQTLKQPRD